MRRALNIMLQNNGMTDFASSFGIDLPHPTGRRHVIDDA